MFLKFLLVLLLFDCLHLSLCDTDHTPRVFIDNNEFKGSIVGTKFQESTVEFMGFRGIPYAKPPINELRFKDPQKLDKFEGTFDATHDGFECCSETARNGSEDCLNLNVYTKQLKPSQLLPVVVLIHPGGLYLGSGASYYMRPGHMMTQDVVLVTFNHRLGSLGFLNLGTPDIPGNAGFKDQVYALRWVQNFIENFGGNPQDVTLMGYSAGALSVQVHLMSDMSKDLFHKAILMSGSVAPQAFLPQGQQKYLAVRLAKGLKCEKFLGVQEENPYGVDFKFSDYEEIKNEDILECLSQHNGTVIGNSLRLMFDFGKDNPIILWLPVIERDFQQERFLTENLNVARKNVLMGYTNGELCLSAKDILEVKSVKTKFSQEFRTLAPRTFMYERHPKRDVITEAIVTKFFNGSTNFTLKDYDALCDVFSDTILRFGSHKLAEFLSKSGGQVYFYEFTFMENYTNNDDMFKDKQGEHELLQKIYLYILNKSSARCEHMIDFQYLFNWPGRKHDSDIQKKIIKLYTGFIYDFVKNGKLSDTKAKPYPHSYALIKDNIEYVEGRNFKNYEFWLQHFPDYFNYKLN
ncbi:hypothetical protein FF38_04618 [Lucilia cuprina]|uniref:Carboxylic ester hydrolase n=1 Tax=Lucilia cuprina TaxID=7375 RepID=A0A0L0BWG9_LUCCU|nr:Esterase FE4 [Lucilia cuprina]KNC24367.1 hypothetical protein FF38_04618 [Lucilia cuprina]